MTLLLTLLTIGSANAQDHLGEAWISDDFPVPYEISNQPEDSLPEGYQFEAIQSAYQVWADSAACAGLSFEYQGETDLNTGYTFDYHNRHSFDDPADSLGPGVLAATLNQPSFGAPKAFVKNGRTYDRILDSDIVWNDNVDYATTEAIENGTCSGEHSFEAIAVHEIGHKLGMAHTCEQNDVCNRPEKLEATMNWTDNSGACSLQQLTPNWLDIQNMESLYGPSASFECSHELSPGSTDTIAVGNVPFELKCRMKSDVPDEVVNAEWYFGDGGVDTELDGTHMYTEAGNYTVRVCFQGENDTCGEWEHCFRREGYVRACAVPEPSFTIDHVNGLTHDLLNDTDLSVYGCIFEVQWDIFRDGEAEPFLQLRSWEPQVTFDEPGDYRIVLNVGGPAGTGAAELVTTIKSRVGEGYGACATGPATGFGGALLVMPLIILGRRRRE